MTKSEAIAKSGTKWWENSTPFEIVQFQLFEDRLCMPFEKFQQALEDVLDRPVFTHELAEPSLLRKEFNNVVHRPFTV